VRSHRGHVAGPNVKTVKPTYLSKDGFENGAQEGISTGGGSTGGGTGNSTAVPPVANPPLSALSSSSSRRAPPGTLADPNQLNSASSSKRYGGYRGEGRTIITTGSSTMVQQPTYAAKPNVSLSPTFSVVLPPSAAVTVRIPSACVAVVLALLYASVSLW
jgi:hypothetical protein